jgi:hypothetical protein
MEYLILSAVGGWLCRGCLQAYRQRSDLSMKEAIVVILGGGGPVPQK